MKRLLAIVSILALNVMVSKAACDALTSITSDTSVGRGGKVYLNVNAKSLKNCPGYVHVKYKNAPGKGSLDFTISQGRSSDTVRAYRSGKQKFAYISKRGFKKGPLTILQKGGRSLTFNDFDPATNTAYAQFDKQDGKFRPNFKPNNAAKSVS